MDRINAAIAAGDYAHADYSIDSVGKAALRNSDSTTWVEAKIMRAVCAYYRGDPGTLLAAGDSAIEWLSRRPDSDRRTARLLFKAYQTRGSYYSQYAYQPDSAILYQRRGADCARRGGDASQILQAFGNLADTYKLTGHFPEAMEYYLRAIAMGDSLGIDPYGYIPLYGGLAHTYTSMRDFERSREWWIRTMSLYDRMGPYEKFNNLNNLGNDAYYREDYKGAMATFRRLAAYLDSLPGAEWERHFAAVNLADCELRLNLPDSAAPRLDYAERYFTEVQPNPVVMSYLHTLRMRQYQAWGAYAAVEDMIDRHPFSDTLRAEQGLARLEVMTDYYTATGQYRQALEIHRLHDAMEDTLRSERVEQLATAHRIQYESTTEMLRLRADREAANARVLRLSLVLLVGAGVLALLAGGLVYYRVRTRRKEERMHAEMIALRMESVRTRITPHFIYNALNQEILARTEGSPSRLGSIVSLLRHQQYAADEIVTTLERELQFVNEYVEVQRATIPGELEYEVLVASDVDTRTMLVPSMSLQILVENAFKHAFRHMDAGSPKFLRISVTRDTDTRMTILSVFNNSAPGIPPQDRTHGRRHGGTGTRIIARTLSFINSKVHTDLRFRFQPQAVTPWGAGSLATITIPDDADLTHLHEPEE